MAQRDRKYYNHSIRFVLLILILLICWQLSRFFNLDIQYFFDLLNQFPIALSGLIFILLYVGLTTFIWFGPKDVLRIVAALFFGAYVSTMLLWMGETINTVILFHLSRRLGRDYVLHKFHLRSKDIDRIEKDQSNRSFIGALAMKSNVIFPMRLLDLGFGLTDIKFRKYFFASLVALPLRILLFQYLIAILGENYAKIFKDINAVAHFYAAHPHVLKYTCFYILMLVVFTALALIQKVRKVSASAPDKP